MTSERDQTKVKGFCLEVEDQTVLMQSQQKIQQIVDMTAQGDLTNRLITTDYGSVFQPFVEGMNQILNTFNEKLLDITEVGQNLAENVGSVSGSSATLSNVAVIQSTAVTEAAATLEELSAMVDHNASSSGQSVQTTKMIVGSNKRVKNSYRNQRG